MNIVNCFSFNVQSGNCDNEYVREYVGMANSIQDVTCPFHYHLNCAKLCRFYEKHLHKQWEVKCGDIRIKGPYYEEEEAHKAAQYLENVRVVEVVQTDEGSV